MTLVLFCIAHEDTNAMNCIFASNNASGCGGAIHTYVGTMSKSSAFENMLYTHLTEHLHSIM